MAITSPILWLETANNVLSRVAGKTASAGTTAMFSTRDGPGRTFVRNTSLWCSEIDFTGWSAWTDDNDMSLVLLDLGGSTSDICIYPNHVNSSTLSVAIFVDNDDNYVEVGFGATAQVGSRDYKIYRLDTALCLSRFKGAKILPANWRDYMIGNSFGWGVRYRHENDYGVHVIRWPLLDFPAGSILAPWEQRFGGPGLPTDSGCPEGLILDGEFVPNGMVASGQILDGSFESEINTAIAATGASGSVQIYDLSAFTPQTGITSRTVVVNGSGQYADSYATLDAAVIESLIGYNAGFDLTISCQVSGDCGLTPSYSMNGASVAALTIQGADGLRPNGNNFGDSVASISVAGTITISGSAAGPQRFRFVGLQFGNQTASASTVFLDLHGSTSPVVEIVNCAFFAPVDYGASTSVILGSFATAGTLVLSGCWFLGTGSQSGNVTFFQTSIASSATASIDISDCAVVCRNLSAGIGFSYPGGRTLNLAIRNVVCVGANTSVQGFSTQSGGTLNLSADSGGNVSSDGSAASFTGGSGSTAITGKLDTDVFMNPASDLRFAVGDYGLWNFGDFSSILGTKDARLGNIILGAGPLAGRNYKPLTGMLGRAASRLGHIVLGRGVA